MSATLSVPPNEYPERSGWVLEDHIFKIKWFEGSPTPRALDVFYDEKNGGKPRVLLF